MSVDIRLSRGGTHLRDLALHDQEVRVVDIQLYALEERLDRVLLGFVPVQEVLGDVRKSDLTGNGQPQLEWSSAPRLTRRSEVHVASRRALMGWKLGQHCARRSAARSS